MRQTEPQEPSRQTRRPNILLLVADQMRWDCLGAAGQNRARTPHLDRLAADGAVFENAYTSSPVCVPARQAMLSGRSAESCGSLWNPDFFATRELEPQPDYWLAGLARAGYHSTLIGKWNINGARTPQDFGYSEHISVRDYDRLLSEKYPNLTYTNSWFGEVSPVALEDSRTHWMARQACAALQRQTGATPERQTGATPEHQTGATPERQTTPWLIRVDFVEPHLPCRPSRPFVAPEDPLALRPWDSYGDRLEGKPYIQRQQIINWRLEDYAWTDFQPTVGHYLATVAQLDDACGRILDTLEELGAAEDTLVIFTSDHGDLCGGHGMLDKHYVLYDDVTRVPLVLRWPGRIAAGTSCGGFVSSTLDLGATIRQICALDGVSDGHGRSWLSLITGPSDADNSPHDTAVFAGNGQQFGLYSQRGIRTADWLYIWNPSDVDELYAVAGDPGQRHNLVADPKLTEVIAELRRRLHAELLRREDRLAASGWLDGQLLDNRKRPPG